MLIDSKKDDVIQLIAFELVISFIFFQRNRPFLCYTELTTIARFILSMANHPTMQRLELHHIQTYTLKAFGDQFAKRVKGKYFVFDWL